MRQQEEMKHSILSQVLDQQARARRMYSIFNTIYYNTVIYKFLFIYSEHFKNQQT